MKIGIFGGSFDPVHYAHLLLAEMAREQAMLDEIWFVPAAQSPLKPSAPIANNKQRSEMLQLALSGNQTFQLSALELDRPGASYTVDTLSQIKSDWPGHELFLLIGADSLVSLPKWKQPQRICELALPLVAARRGADANLNQLDSLVEADRLQTIRKYQFEFPWIEISSTEIRAAVAEGKSIRYRTPRSVEKYIQTSNLYR